jgi:hypothetical protein
MPTLRFRIMHVASSFARQDLPWEMLQSRPMRSMLGMRAPLEMHPDIHVDDVQATRANWAEDFLQYEHPAEEVQQQEQPIQSSSDLQVTIFNRAHEI